MNNKTNYITDEKEDKQALLAIYAMRYKTPKWTRKNQIALREALEDWYENTPLNSAEKALDDLFKNFVKTNNINC